MTKLTPRIAKNLGYARQRASAHRARLARVSKTAELIRQLKRRPTRADLNAIADKIGVTERTVYRYLARDMSNLEICHHCGRPYAEDKIIAAMEEIGAIPPRKAAE